VLICVQFCSIRKCSFRRREGVSLPSSNRRRRRLLGRTSVRFEGKLANLLGDLVDNRILAHSASTAATNARSLVILHHKLPPLSGSPALATVSLSQISCVAHLFSVGQSIELLLQRLGRIETGLSTSLGVSDGLDNVIREHMLVGTVAASG